MRRVLAMLSIGGLLLLTGCGHNTGVLTLGTRAHIGIDPQNITADISYNDGLNISEVARENSTWIVEIDAVNGVTVSKDGSIKGIKRVRRSIGPQMNGYLVDLAKADPELARIYAAAIKAYWESQVPDKKKEDMK